MHEKQITALLLMLAMTACASQPLYMVNAFGDRSTCQPTSNIALLNKVLPNSDSHACKTALKDIGYLPESDAGMIPITLAMDGTTIVASSLPDAALEQQPDLHPGDQILSIDNQKAESMNAATNMLFGRKGSIATIILGRDNLEFPVQLTRVAINHAEKVQPMPEALPLSTPPMEEPYSNQSADAPVAAVTTADQEVGLLHRIKTLFSSLMPSQHPAEAIPSSKTLPASPQDSYSNIPPPTSTATDITALPSTESEPLPALTPPPPLMIAGDQVCRARNRFIDVGRVEEVRAERMLVTIDHIQLIHAPFTEFHHFKQEQLWSPLKAWQPCSGEAPLFLH